ncbi:WAP four-disulfide core domain protein 1 [Orchesella cincta]|uniref:WAP four-disulfide core domain protein 1 n=1 Tax=Orchesella cincta TaxID=48709 RepID=A0A1D2N6M8_ORCCI|nr:WAP four-disulfide core domain protein 1 [Orchesella cincta]
MAANLSFVSAIFILITTVGYVKCGRFPTGTNSIYQIKDSDDYSYKSEEYFSGLDIDDGDDDAAAYITDVQIDEFQNAQEKRKQDQAIFHVDPRCPKFNGDCAAYICDSDNNCGGDKICCFNGCVQTCVADMSAVSSPPIAIDWLPEETLKKLEYSYSGTNRVITIPGGCRVTQQQQRNLDLFLKYGHVTKCLCKKEDVVCYVRNNAV